MIEFSGRTKVEKRRRGGKQRKRTVRIATRPHMASALEKERSKLPKVWHNSVRGR